MPAEQTEEDNESRQGNMTGDGFNKVFHVVREEYKPMLTGY
jgi:hypothetical protein